MAMEIQESSFEIDFACDQSDELILIGDIHGYADLLDALLERASNIPRHPGRDRTVVFLGDLIDRGSESIRCLDLAIGAKARLGCNVIGLLGNHEQFLRIALEENGRVSDLAAANWMRNGGGNVIMELHKKGQPLDLPEALGERRLTWLQRLRSHFVSGDIMAVHAGLNPDVPTAEFLAEPWMVDYGRFREARHWAWVREPFLDHQPDPKCGHQGYFVVHGHTPDDVSLEHQLRRCRLNLDGGSYKTGRARMLHLSGFSATRFEAIA